MREKKRKIPFEKLEKAYRLKFVDEDRLALLGQKFFNVWDCDAGELLHKFDCHKDLKLRYGRDFAVSVATDTMVLKSTQGVLAAYDLFTTSKRASTQSYESDVALSADGSHVYDFHLVVGSATTLLVRRCSDLEVVTRKEYAGASATGGRYRTPAGKSWPSR